MVFYSIHSLFNCSNQDFISSTISKISTFLPFLNYWYSSIINNFHKVYFKNNLNSYSICFNNLSSCFTFVTFLYSGFISQIWSFCPENVCFPGGITYAFLAVVFQEVSPNWVIPGKLSDAQGCTLGSRISGTLETSWSMPCLDTPLYFFSVPGVFITSWTSYGLG